MSTGAVLHQVERQRKEFPLGSRGPPPPPESAALGFQSHQSHGSREGGMYLVLRSGGRGRRHG